MFSRKRAISFLCAACMLCSLIIMALPAPVYGTGLSEQLEQARQEKEALENQIKAIRADKNKVLQQKKLLDQRNETLRNEVNLIQKQSDETQARIVDLTAKEEQQYALFCRQVRAEEERGTESYWSVIFKSADFADLLARLDFVSEVMDYDRKVIEDLQATRQQLTEDKAALERQKAELVSAQAELQKDIDEADALIRDYEKSEAGHNALLNQAKQDEERIQELIRQQQQSGGSSDGYIWPSNNSHRISDSYGWRICPFHGREFHNGIDIDARRAGLQLRHGDPVRLERRLRHQRHDLPPRRHHHPVCPHEHDLYVRGAEGQQGADGGAGGQHRQLQRRPHPFHHV